MASKTMPDKDTELLARISGIPPRGELGASKGEMFALILAVVVFASILIAFWLQSTP